MRFYFSPHGRISRTQFWLASLGAVAFLALPYGLLSLIAARVLASQGSLHAGNMALPTLGLGVLPTLLSIWATLSTGIKRYHDRGKPGWWVLVYFVPVAGVLWHYAEAGFLPGTNGPNPYGEDPRRRAPRP